MTNYDAMAEKIVQEFLGQTLSSTKDVDDWLRNKIATEIHAAVENRYGPSILEIINKAKAEAYEEAATVADDLEKIHHNYTSSWEEGFRDCADLAVRKIRALREAK